MMQRLLPSALPAALLLLLILGGCAPKPVLEAEPPSPLIPDFTISADELALFAAEIDERGTAERILARPAEFLILMREVLDADAELFLIADKNRSLGSDYIPSDLVSLNEFPLARSRGDLRLRKIVMPDLLAMNQAAANNGLTLVFSSSYRSYDYQKGLFARYVDEMGEEEASRVSARPGTSQHQLGTTIDLGSITDAFAATDEGRWMADNAWRYGFSLSYPDGLEERTGYVWESWHYRYIGRPAAELERRYFDSVQYYLLYFLDTYRGWFEERRVPVEN